MNRSSQAFSLVLSLVAAGCVSSPKPYNPTSGARTLFLPVIRQNAPEPVYNRLRWVQLPEVIPERDIRGAEAEAFSSAAPIRPVYHMTLKNTSLLDTSRVLAATARYEAFCAPSIADQKFSIDSLGTIDELGSMISKRADINVVVDHENHVVRFLAHEMAQPQLFNE